MKIKEKIIISFSVYNSYQNLESIFIDIQKSSFNNVVKKIIIIDNNSKININQKINFIKSLSKKYKKKIKLIINYKNYGLGGSQKILFKILKKENFTYLINAHTSGRYKIINQLKFINKTTKHDYIQASRFLKKSDSKNYSLLRKVFNYIFKQLTIFTTECKLSDPGCAIYMISKKLLFKIMPTINNLTNYSHFNHLMNVVIYKHNPSIYEYPIVWNEGAIKSHLRPINYVTQLFLSLIFYYFNKKFYKIKNINYKFKTYKF